MGCFYRSEYESSHYVGRPFRRWYHILAVVVLQAGHPPSANFGKSKAGCCVTLQRVFLTQCKSHNSYSHHERDSSSNVPSSSSSSLASSSAMGYSKFMQQHNSSIPKKTTATVVSSRLGLKIIYGLPWMARIIGLPPEPRRRNRQAISPVVFLHLPNECWKSGLFTQVLLWVDIARFSALQHKLYREQPLDEPHRLERNNHHNQQHNLLLLLHPNHHHLLLLPTHLCSQPVCPPSNGGRAPINR